jgi:hypothetical protein
MCQPFKKKKQGDPTGAGDQRASTHVPKLLPRPQGVECSSGVFFILFFVFFHARNGVERPSRAKNAEK